jgi:hypothetical protein
VHCPDMGELELGGLSLGEAILELLKVLLTVVNNQYVNGSVAH